MKIDIKRSGGFAGLSEQLARVDTKVINPQVAALLESLIASINFFQLPPQLGAGTGADVFRYDICINDGANSHSVSFLDDGSPESALLRNLVQAALLAV